MELSRIDHEGGVLVKPDPAYVLKANHTGRKLFVNIGSSEFLKDRETQKDNSIRIPLSIGPLDKDHDKDGRECDVVDIIVSRATVSESLADSDFRKDFVQLITDNLHRKYSISLDQSLKLIHKQYKGDSVREQRLRVPPSNLLIEVKCERMTEMEILPFEMVFFNPHDQEELDYNEYIYANRNEVLLEHALQLQLGKTLEPDACDQVDFKSYKSCRLTLKNIADVSKMSVRASSHRLRVCMAGIPVKNFDIWFPVPMDPTECECRYDAITGVIIITLHVV